jgi:hypothetical protein
MSPRPSHLPLVTTAIVILCAPGCRPPLEEAPEQIDDPIQYLFVNFEDEDPAGLLLALDTYTGFLDECEATADGEGGNSRPECDLEQGLSTAMITDDDLAELVDIGKLAAYPTDEYWQQAVSIVVAQQMPMTVEVVEDVLIQPGQDQVFPQFETYERTYLTSEDDYLDGSEDFLRTSNEVLSNYVLNVTAEYLLYLDFRQLAWDDGESERRVVIIRSWFEDEAVLSMNDAAVGFTYSLEVLIPYTADHDQVWRTQALWSHADIPGTGDDQAFWENQLRDGTIDGFDQLQAWVDGNY